MGAFHIVILRLCSNRNSVVPAEFLSSLPQSQSESDAPAQLRLFHYPTEFSYSYNHFLNLQVPFARQLIGPCLIDLFLFLMQFLRFPFASYADIVHPTRKAWNPALF